MRLTDADREALLERLKQHAAVGSIELDELERRVGLIHAAQTHQEAAAVMSDLPPLPADPGDARSGRVPQWLWARPHGESTTPAPGWSPTSERFRDPGSGRVMRVWLDASGGRHYVPDEDSR